ncbi:MAG TPA: FAD-dependent oxidoreductase [Clostridiales bacterium]|jgi:hypothetical protein|nr:FAD-dependent oxidoreductase [Clostridiales bacterium]
MVKSIIEEKREIPVAGEADVIVVGGGLAGVGAAVAAARNGMSVILIEKSFVLGGLATLGHVCVYLPLDDGLGHKIHGGLAEELLYVCCRYSYNTIPDCWKGGPSFVENPEGRYQTTFNIPACIMALDEFLEAEHVKVIFDTNFCLPIMEGNLCKGVIVENKSGRSAYLAKMVVDASGDADVLFRAGAECETQKNIVSHWTYEVDVEKIRNGNARDVLHNVQMRWFGLRPDVDNSGSKLPTFYGTTCEGVNDYIKLSRSLALDYLKKNQRDGYAMMTLPFMPQFRMTRRLKGLKEMEAVPRVHVESSVGCVIHCLESPEEVYEFPYEALIDSRIENIVAAGRIVSAGGRAWEIMRFIPSCVLTGQAAGTAAAMAIKAGCSLQKVDIAALQENLAATGVMIHMTEELRNNKRKSGKKALNIPPINTDSLSYAH